MASVESIIRQPIAEDPPADACSGKMATRADARQALVEEALTTWLRWNSVYEQVTAAMFEQRSNLRQLHEMLDLAEEVRRKAVTLTQALLGP